MNYLLARNIGIIVVVVIIAIGIGYAVSASGTQNGGCTIASINLHGDLYTTDALVDQSSTTDDIAVSASITKEITKADSDPSIRAIVLDIDSGGGSPVAGEEIANALKRSSKPTVALVHSFAASAAYWAATGAGSIFASKNSDVGSIGVTSSYLDEAGKDAKDGITFHSISSGPYKDTGNPDKSLTPQEYTYLKGEVSTVYKNFIDAVAQNRKLSTAKVTAVADGSTMLGDAALNAGLIDFIGDSTDVESYLAQKFNINGDICNYDTN